MGEFDLDEEELRLEKDLEKLLRRGRAPALDDDDDDFDNRSFTSTTAIVGVHPEIIEQQLSK